MPDPLLELPAVGVRVARLDALELGPRLVELALGPLRIDLLSRNRVVHERDRAVLLDLEEAGAGRELLHLGLGHVYPRVARVQHRHEWRVPCEDADLAGRAGDD